MDRLTKSIDISFDMLDAALEESGKSYSHFSFIWKRNTLVSIGQNYPAKPSAKALYFARRFGQHQIKKFPYVHSEIDAIQRAWGKIKLGREHILINTRVNRNGTLGNSRPCKQCQIVLNAIGFRKVEWT